MKIEKLIGGFLLGLGMLGFAAVALNALGYSQFAFWAPKFEQVRQDVFKESQAYRDGTLQDFENLRLAYESATTQGAKDAVRDTLRRRLAVIDRNRLTPELRQFVTTLGL